MSEITVATSIIPRNIDLQRAAIESWRTLGFQVISLNSASEAESITHEFPDIPVHIVSRTVEHLVGKPCVFFDDVRTALEQKGSELCGIVNPDIFFSADDGFIDFIAKAVEGGNFLFGSRIDVESLDNLDGEKFIYGFDYFFFTRDVLGIYPDTGFCLGVPWWDYWAPLVPLLHGRRCLELISPVAFHIKHETKWAGNLFVEFGQKYALEYEALAKGRPVPETWESPQSPEAVTIFSFDVLGKILDESDKLVYLVPGRQDSLVEVGRNQYLAMRDQVLEHRRNYLQLHEHYTRLAHAASQQESELNQTQSRLQEVYDSVSWRLTKLLRVAWNRIKQRSR